MRVIPIKVKDTPYYAQYYQQSNNIQSHQSSLLRIKLNRYRGTTATAPPNNTNPTSVIIFSINIIPSKSYQALLEVPVYPQ